jgi:hypothetical protein
MNRDATKLTLDDALAMVSPMLAENQKFWRDHRAWMQYQDTELSKKPVDELSSIEAAYITERRITRV